MEEEPEKYQSHFSEYIKKEIEPESIGEMYKKVHAAIRADPTVKKSEKQPPKQHKRWCLLLIYFVAFGRGCIYYCYCHIIIITGIFIIPFDHLYLQCNLSWNNLCGGK